MPKGIPRLSDPRAHGVSPNQDSVRGHSNRKSRDAGQPSPCATPANGFKGSSTLPNTNGSRCQSTDGSNRKTIKASKDIPKPLSDDELTHKKTTLSKKPHMPPGVSHLNGKKRYVSASDTASTAEKKPRLDILSKVGEKKVPPAPESGGQPGLGEELVDADITKERCHQCRIELGLEHILVCQNDKPPQKTKRVDKPHSSLEATALNLQNADNSSPLPLVKCRAKYCEKCLRSRYGECLTTIRPSTTSSYVWTCPMCMDYCNCSTCRKRKGLLPTGRLLKVASQGGYSSARELLEANPNAQGSDMIALANNKKQKLDQVVERDQNPDVKEAKPPKKAKTKSDVEDLDLHGDKATDNKAGRKKDAKPESQNKKPKAKPAVKVLPTEESSKQHLAPPAISDTSLPQGIDTQAKAAVAAVPKAPVKRGPRPVPAPKCLFSIPTGDLSSEQIRMRLHIREFVCRFRSLLPGLGRTEHANAKNETQRVEKILDSMDDVVNFWIDDEGGMRAIMSGLVRLIISEIDQEDPDSSSVLLSSSSRETLTQLNKESRLTSVIPNPYQNGFQCWSTAQIFLTQEGLGDQLTDDIKQVYLDTEHTLDDRIVRLKVLPEQKLAVITGLIDVALRGSILSEDIVQGIERERQAKADIVKERAKLNKQWQETRARSSAAMPSKESLLEGDPPAKGKQLQKLQEREDERIRLLSEWEAETSQAESEHKNELRLSGIAQYLAGSVNRIRFLPIGRDTRNNSYYILSSTPGRLYPKDPSELAYAWSYNIIIHGSEPTDISQSVQNPGSIKIAAPTPAASEVPSADDQIDMLEGGQRAADDQWIRVSDPHEIRKLGAWIEYEARLMEHRQLESLIVDNDPPPTNGESVASKVVKNVAMLVEQINTFAEYLELKINEAEEQIGKRGLKSRTTTRAGL